MLCTEISLAFFPPIGIVLYYKTSLIGLYTSIGTLNSLNKVIQTLILSVDNNIHRTCIRCPWEIKRTTQSQTCIKKNIAFFITLFHVNIESKAKSLLLCSLPS